MRLINVHTLTVEDHSPRWDRAAAAYRPSYAILSHTWHDAEVTFADLGPDRRFPAAARAKLGWPKIQRSVDQARDDGHDYVWVDTCCIDKSSSAELSEAINSMFEWYRRAAVCYAFLADLAPPHRAGARDLLSRCRWFTRGWTLQELVAPKRVAFYDADWSFLGTKEDLVEPLSDITRIPALALVEGAGDAVVAGTSLDQFTVAQKMAWAARRVTTREEDLSYCLLGMFDIHMPLLYGEGGERAFLRLQEAIMQRYDDDSIFAWRGSGGADGGGGGGHDGDGGAGGGMGGGGGTSGRGGLLAVSPACFSGCEGVLSVPTDPFVDFLGVRLQFSPAAVTSRGLRVHRLVWPDGYWLLMPLRCWDVRRQPGPGKSIISITLTEHGVHETDQYSRLDWMTVSVDDLREKMERRRCEEREFYLLPSHPASHHGLGLELGWLVTSSRDVWIRSLPDGCLMHGFEASDPARVHMSEKTRLCGGLEVGNWVAFILRCPAAPTAPPPATPTHTLTPGPPETTVTPLTSRPPARDLYVSLFVFLRSRSERPLHALASGPDPSSVLRAGHDQLMSAAGAGQHWQPGNCPGPDGTTLYALLDTGERGGAGGGGGGGGRAKGGAGGARRLVVDVFAMGNNRGAKVWDLNSPLLGGGGEADGHAAAASPPRPEEGREASAGYGAAAGIGIRPGVEGGTIAQRRRSRRQESESESESERERENVSPRRVVMDEAAGGGGSGGRGGDDGTRVDTADDEAEDEDGADHTGDEAGGGRRHWLGRPWGL